jgi:heparanase
LLWRRLMSPTVLESDVPIREGLHLYAHCLRGTPGGVALLAINNSRTRPTSIMFPNGADRYELSARDFGAMQVQLNGEVLKLSTADKLPALKPIHISAGAVELQPTTISFFAVLNADNPSCREG